jgi:hypothetical protein
VTRFNKPFSNGPLVRLLTNPFYAGRLRWKDVMAAGTHPPLIPQAMFDQVQDVLRRRGRDVVRRGSKFLLVGVARCSTCGELMSAEQHGKLLYYRCRGSTRLTNRCHAPYSPGRKTHEALESVYLRLVPTTEFKQRVIRQVTDHASAGLADNERSRQTLRLELVSLMGRETRLASMFADGLLDADAYELAQGRIAKDRVDLTSRLDAIGDRDVRAITRLAAHLERASSVWEIHLALSLDQQRRLAQAIFSDLRLSADGISDYRVDPSLTEQAA